MKKSPSKLQIRRETLAALSASPMARVAGATWHVYCTEFCTLEAICRTGTCPSIEIECRPSEEPSCFC